MTIYPTQGNPNVFATSTDQWMIGEPGYNYFGYSGSLQNTVSYQLATGPVIASLANPSINTGAAAGDTYSDIQNLTGSPYGGTLYGNNSGQAQQLWALGGTSSLFGGSGYTTFIAGPGSTGAAQGPVTMVAGAGGGLADYEVAPAGVTVSLLNPSMNTGWAAGDSYSGIHNIAGSGFGNNTLIADNSGDNLLGNGQDDTLIGGAGNDTLNPGAGGGSMTGGAGANWFVFGGAYPGPNDVAMDPVQILHNAEAGIYTTITDFNQGGGASYNASESDRIDVSTLVSSLNDGADSVGSLVQVVEDASGSFAWLQFYASGWVTIARMNGLQTGETVGVILNESNSQGFSVIVQPASAQPAPVPPANSWSVVGSGDFNGDGDADLLWRYSTGTLAEWLMDGSAISSGAVPTFQGSAITPDSSWSVAGVGDFNGNGEADMLWRQSSTGSLAEWLMDGSAITSGPSVTSNGVAVSPDSTWSVAGIGDFNGDGKADILWRQSTTGSLADWMMNGSVIASSASLTYHGSAVTPDSTWSVVGIGDFNGDGDADVLWRQSTTGSLAEWLMDGSAITTGPNVTSNGVAVTPDSTWSVAGVGDFNGDGEADILWQQSSTGSLAVWLMNGSSIQSSAAVTYQGSVIIPDSSWKVLEVGDFDGGKDAGIIWQQTTTGDLVEWQMNGSQIVSSETITFNGSPVRPNPGTGA